MVISRRSCARHAATATTEVDPHAEAHLRDRGVASSLGKGLTASSLGRLLKLRGLRVTMQKLDPYINVDPGTMNPFEHGEVFVTDDGGETDLDLGHYERFIDENLSRALERHDRARSTSRCSPPSGAATTSARPCR